MAVAVVLAQEQEREQMVKVCNEYITELITGIAVYL